MRFSTCLLPVAILSTGVSAFFPYKSKAQTSKDEGKLNGRFIAYPGKDDGVKQPPSLGIGKVETGTVLGDNNYDIAEGKSPKKENSIAIGSDKHDFSYVTRVSFGSQDQELWMLLDTGAATTWVMGADCTTDSCAKHDTFDDESSTTFSETGDDLDVSYGGGEVTGTGAKDNVTLGGLEAVMEFGVATDTSSDFMSYPMDGILGLGRTGKNEKGIPAVMEALSSAGLIDANILGINLPRSSDGNKDGQITFGDIDTEKFTGDIVYTDAVSDSDIWLIPVDDAGVDDSTAGFTNKKAIVDTGTSYILLPKSDMEELHTLIPDSEADDDEFLVPCSTKAVLQFTFSGTTFDVSTVDFVESSDGSSDKCSTNIKTLPDSYGPDMWLLGDVFLKNVYSVFDFDKSRIGFATLGDDESSSTSDGSFSSEDSSSTTSTATGSAATGSAATGSAATGSAPEPTGAGATVSTSPQLVLTVSIITVVFSSIQFIGLF